MSGYIDREAVLSELEEELAFDSPMYTDEQQKYFTMGLRCAYRDVKSQPTADVVEVRHGEWREVNDKYPRYVCTVCNHLFNNKNYNYCPCCGAKMDGERREE